MKMFTIVLIGLLLAHCSGTTYVSSDDPTPSPIPSPIPTVTVTASPEPSSMDITGTTGSEITVQVIQLCPGFRPS